MHPLCYIYRGMPNTKYTEASRNNTATEQKMTGRLHTDRWRETETGRTAWRRNADYLRKQAASEEVGQSATLTGDSCTDLRRDGGEMRWIPHCSG